MKLLSKLIVSTLLLGSSAFATDFSATPLIGLEGSYGMLDANGDQIDMYGMGIKLGAKSEEYRLFLSARKFQIDGFDSASALGAEVQYLIPLSQSFDIFLGGNVGQMGMKLGNREMSTMYYGGDAGVTVALSSLIDLELGGRLMYMDYTHTLNSVTYNVDSLVQGYASIIFKLPSK